MVEYTQYFTILKNDRQLFFPIYCADRDLKNEIVVGLIRQGSLALYNGKINSFQQGVNVENFILKAMEEGKLDKEGLDRLLNKDK